MEVVAYGVTDVGRKRDHNEDYMLADETLGLFIVCDGMGGAAAGEVASQNCTELVHELVQQSSAVLALFASDPSTPNRHAAAKVIEDAIHEANAQIYELSVRDKAKRGMGTTIVALLVAGENAIAAHVGDSRIYLLRDDRIHQLTEDHSLIAEQLKRGLITPEEAEISAFGNVIMRAVGTREATQVDTLHLELMPGDRFLLCSDGLSGMVGATDLGTVLSDLAPKPAAEKLVDLANAAGGKDNITALCLLVANDMPTTAQIPVTFKVDVLRQIPLFAHLTYKELMTLLDVVDERDYAEGQVMIQEGAVEGEFFVLLKGQAQVTQNRQLLAELGSGALFGEMCLLDDAPRSATIVAQGDCRVMVIRRDDLYPLLQREPQLAVKLLWSFCQVMISRLRDTNAELTDTRRQIERMLSRSQIPFTKTRLDAVATRHGIEGSGVDDDATWTG